MSETSKTVLLHGINEGLSVTQFDPKHRPDLIPGLINCYRRVFAEQPWNEWKRCPKCHETWGLDQMQELVDIGFSHCGILVADVWEICGVKKDIEREIARTDNASSWLLQNNEDVVGFIWGYPMNTRHLSSKLGLDIFDVLQNKFGVTTVAYLDDTGIYATYRKRGLAQILLDLWAKDMAMNGRRVIVARTQATFADKEATVLYHWFIKMGYEVIARYSAGTKHEADVILAK